MEIMLASGNAHKRAEFARMLPSWDVLLPQERGIDFSCEEDGTTFINNVLAKDIFRLAPPHIFFCYVFGELANPSDNNV